MNKKKAVGSLKGGRQKRNPYNIPGISVQI